MYLKIILFSTIISLLTITFLKVDNVQHQIIVFLAFLILFLIFTKTFSAMIDKNKINHTINGILDNDITTRVNVNGANVNGNGNGNGANGNGNGCNCVNGNGCNCVNGGECTCGDNCNCNRNGNGANGNGANVNGANVNGANVNGGNINVNGNVNSNLHKIAPNDYPPINCSKKDCHNYNFNYNDLIDKRDTNDYTLDQIIPNNNYNQRDCMNDHSCVINPDQCNMFPN